jgi:hypothetical protein
MANIRAWLDKGNLSSERMPLLLTILIRQARLEKSLTYGDVASELGVHHRTIPVIAGYIGHTLAEIGRIKAWKSNPPPPLHSLIVNEVTRLPGTGIDGFMHTEYIKAGSNEDKRAILKAVYSKAKHYPKWEELCELLKIPMDMSSLATAVEQARESKGRGGEGPHHLALKNYVLNNPHIVGLKQNSPTGLPEVTIASGDIIDILFKRQHLHLAVEIKPHHASEGDMLRGVFQCLKYQTILAAEATISNFDVNIDTLLVLGRPATEQVKKTANALKVKVLENVKIPQSKLIRLGI